MGALSVTFALYNAETGAPVATAEPTFSRYVDPTGAPTPAPLINALGGGIYGFGVPQEQLVEGVAYLIHSGSYVPEYLSGSAGGRFVAFCLYHPDTGAPMTGQAPTFLRYAGPDGTERTAPPISELGGGLYGFTFSLEDEGVGFSYIISAPGTNTATLFGSVEGMDVEPPKAEVISPVEGTELGPTTPLVVKVTDNSKVLRRVLVVLTFEENGVTELVHDGTGFLGYYALGSTRRLVSDGYEYVILRYGGWPTPRRGTPRVSLTLFGFDTAGLEL